MTQTVHFTKMHGAGNDYIYVDTTRETVPDLEKAAIAWSKPHFGVGSDGLVLIGKGKSGSGADFTMRIFNADGSEAMMCGNASRCIGKYLYEKGLTKEKDIRLGTLSGVKVLHLTTSADGKTVEKVNVDMLEPRFEVADQWDPAARDAEVDKILAEVEATESKFVSMGNPHFVIFTKRDVEQMDIRKYGPILERDKMFPQRCNIEFAQPLGADRYRTRVWERGSGITMACGTGACATAVAAAATGIGGRQSDIIMDGGTLHIEWKEDDHVWLSGPAAFVFEGVIALP